MTMHRIRRLVLVIAFLGMAVESADGFIIRRLIRRWYWSNYYATWNYPTYYGGVHSSYYYPMWGYSNSYYGPAYYYQPTYAYQIPQCVTPPQVAVAAVPKTYATPVAAPPSTNNEPPLAESRKPKISESRFPVDKSDGDDKKTVTTKLQAPSCRVGFWNVSGTNITLTINGQAHYIARNKAVTVMVTPEFEYQVDQRTVQNVSVPSKKRSWEIVIR